MILSPAVCFDPNHVNTIFVGFCKLSGGLGAGSGVLGDVVHGHGSVTDPDWSPMLQGYPLDVRYHLH
eukprot:gene22429-biopygen1922